MFPHERSLVKRLQGQPFALVGVNSDGGREKLKAMLDKERITWRSFWDGGDTDGPIATRWNVLGWPAVYVLDAKGAIRYRHVRGETLDRVVDELMTEAKKSR
ncbi:MAG: TlpA family protein disulfide reductase [Planctomycetes bacterium]|nr:TlpA family protein disulfide reductase [Planctomycetota bacterium]